MRFADNLDMRFELAIIGAGVMGEVVARGVLSRGTLSAEQIVAVDVSAERRRVFQEQLRIAAREDAAEAASAARTILLSVKPYQMEQVLGAIGPKLDASTLVISLAAGISSGFIEQALGVGKKWRVVRSMPNTPMLVGEGMVAIAPGANATHEDLATARRLFESAAKVIEVSEDKIDAVTAVSGSGPAYFFLLVENMIRAGVELGLSPEEARTCAIQTAVGAAKMMSESSDNPAEHRRRVTTPNGTTHAAINHMEAQGLPQTIVDALKAAAKRSREMGK